VGYYTDFSLHIKDDVNKTLMGDDGTKTRIVNYIKSLGDSDYLKEFIDEDGFHDGNTMNAKWYEYEADMRKLSVAVPDVCFELHGEGEEQHDLWISYFLNGKMQRCEAKVSVVYPEFDTEKME